VNYKNIIIRFHAGVMVIAIIFFSCSEQALHDAGHNGILTGKITIGPLCPVETIPPSPACQPTEETYKTWAIAVWTHDKKSKIEVLAPALDGTYITDIPAGDYILDFDSIHNQSIGSSNLPVSITIESQDTTKADIDIDTGIR
jgi:hypothetical protein